MKRIQEALLIVAVLSLIAADPPSAQKPLAQGNRADAGKNREKR